MGSLTESMTRLRNDITASRNACIQLVGHLKDDVAAIQLQFKKSHAEMVKAAKAERDAFVSALGKETAGMISDFRDAHAAMARTTQSERKTFVSGVRNQVSDMQAQARNTLAETAQQRHAEVKVFMSNLKADVVNLRTEFGSKRQELISDIEGARSVWLEIPVPTTVAPKAPAPGGSRTAACQREPVKAKVKEEQT